MRTNYQYGFNVTGLAAMTVAVMLLVLALVPLISNGLSHGEVEGGGRRGREIFVAISGANTEREPLGLPSVWPSEGLRLTNAVDDIASVEFSNSTDYFNVLFDGKNLGTERWRPFVAGFDFSKLAGAGVPACTDGKLTAKNNLWTVAVNVRDEMVDVIPVLVTRNIDASSLASKVTDKDWGKMLRFDPEWYTPYGDKYFVMIRKGGAIFKCRAKYASYGSVYGKQTFDATVDKDGMPVSKPLKYLTPTRVVVPGEQAYAEGTARVARLPAHSVWRNVKRSKGVQAGTCVAGAYLLAAGLFAAARFLKRMTPCLTGYGVGVGLFHYVTVALWLGLILGGALEFAQGWTLLALALLAQAAGIAFVCVRKRGDGVARERGIKWMVAAPLVALILLTAAAFG